jgi:hypothetical protein
VLLRLYNETAELIDHSQKSKSKKENDSTVAADNNANADPPEAGNEEETAIAVGKDEDSLASAGPGASVDDKPEYENSTGEVLMDV